MSGRTNGESRGLVIKDTDGSRKALQARYGDEFNPALTIQTFIAICNRLQLNPWLNHATPIHGRFYVQEQGWIHLINRNAPGQLVELDARPASKDEYETFRVDSADYLAIAWCVRKWPQGNTVRFTRRAIVTQRESTKTSAESGSQARGGKARHIVEDPWDMALKRARVRALRLGFGDCLTRDAGEFEAEIERVNIETGEIIEGTAVTAGEPEVDWSRLWVTAHEQRMDKAAVHEHFGLPAQDGALKDFALAEAEGRGVPLQQVIEDMADALQLPHESGKSRAAADSQEDIFAGGQETSDA